MYATIVRRTPDPSRQQEIRARAASEFFPKLRAAPGFAAFYLLRGEDGQTSAITIWEERAHADAFRPEVERWGHTLDELGSQFDSRVGAEVAEHFTAQAAAAPR